MEEKQNKNKHKSKNHKKRKISINVIFYISYFTYNMFTAHAIRTVYQSMYRRLIGMVPGQKQTFPDPSLPAAACKDEMSP